MNNVLLTQVTGDHYDSFTAEPQMVRIRAGNQSNLVIDSIDVKNFNAPPVRVIAGMSGDGILMRKIKRLTITRAELQFPTPNVNVTNNVFRIYVKDVANAPPFVVDNLRTVVLPEYRYDSPRQLMTALLLLLNSDDYIGADANVLWEAALYKGSPNTYMLQCFELSNHNPHAFYIDNTCLAVVHGEPLWNLPNIAIPPPLTPSESFASRYDRVACDEVRVGPMNMLYTRFVDFHSNTLTQYTKNPSSTTKFGSNAMVHRMYLEPWKQYTSDPAGFQPSLPQFFEDLDIPPNWTSLNIHQSLTTIDIWLTDEFGNDLYVPNELFVVTGFNEYPDKKATLSARTDCGLRWNLVLTTEI